MPYPSLISCQDSLFQPSEARGLGIPLGSLHISSPSAESNMEIVDSVSGWANRFIAQHGKRNNDNDWVIFHGVYVAQLPYPFVCWWAFRLLPCPGYCKQCCDEHWGARVSFRSGFLSVYAQKHETSARAWCTGKTQRNRVEREGGGGIGMGNTCNSMADSCQCMTKSTTIL